MNIEASVLEVFKQVFKREDLILTPQTTATDIRGWDSVSHVRIIVSLEKKLGIKFKASEVVAMRSVGDLYTKVSEKLKT